MREVGVGCSSPGRSFPGNAPPNQEAAFPGEAGACDPQQSAGATVVSTQLTGPEQTTVSSLWPSAYRLAPAAADRYKIQKFLNSQTKEQSSLTALSQQVLPVHSRPQAGKISGHTHGLSTHLPTHLPILRAWAWGVSNASKASAQPAE